MIHTFSTRANEQQRQAITTTEGPLLIIAGPGSGKTFTLVERVVYLITQKQATPESLFVVTFTEKAAAELTTRISNRLHNLNIPFNLNEMFLGTFHSICLRWLQDYREYTRLKRNFMLMDQFDQQYFIYQKINEFADIENIDLLWGDSKKTSRWRKSSALLKWINVVSEEFLDSADLIASNDADIQVLGHVSRKYQQMLEEQNALDFSTIQWEALTLLRNHPEVRDALREQITYFMVDEYQDTNTIQELILRELSGELPNLCVVGDDDQGLYRFRGATIRNILQFKENFPADQCAQVELTTNYRSHPDIIRFYNEWIEAQNWEHQGTKFRYEKTMRPRRDTFPDVPAVVKVAGQTEEAWHNEVLEFLHTMRDDGHLTDWNQVAFLFRSVRNEKAVRLARFLEENGITVYSPRSNQFFGRPEIRLMIGALISLFPQFPQARKWNDDAQLSIWDFYDNECVRPFAEAMRRPENRDLLNWVRRMRNEHYPLVHNTNYPFSGLFYELLRYPMFSESLGEERLQGGLLNSRAMRNLAIFSQMLNKFEYLHHISVLTAEHLDANLRQLFNQFFRFLKDGGINEYEDEAEYAPSGCVSFLTIHQSKGLEFPVVIVGSLGISPRKQYTELQQKLEDGYLHRPSFEPLSETKFYDFWRLYYTAYSRAQNLLVLTAWEKEGRGRTPSKHFSEFYNPIPSWRDPAFIPAKLPLDTVKDVNLKQEYSFTSHLTVFENCAEQYRFYREIGFAPLRTNPILFGTLVHQTIEDIHKTVLKGREERLSEDQIAAWFDTNYAYLTKRERVYLAPVPRRLALDHVMRYFKRYEGNWSHIREAEVDVSLVKDAYILAGQVDLIAGEGDTFELVDFKSEKKIDVNNPEDREKYDRYRRQLEVYAHIVENRYGVTVSKTHLHYTGVESGNPRISFDRNQRSIEQTIDTFDRVVQRIEDKDFAIAERPHKLCEACAMRHYCDAKNWKFRGNS